ncbi:NAD(P)-dependent oxidoreductase [Roseivirga sp. E12]|uniref:NAD(P)-dependent oxidoreductase n=1 Tax=Roseivirga sp. E12 TaxID=2819237 RepID=UPI001ABBF2BC|nr:NAD(P)H-binding protein [Roseivirga sp. E12]MBO3697520.1 NAD(P)H-binding protein [Roseivirga sp. E12]
MKILLLGATGRTGNLVLEQALATGHQVNCLVRSPEKVKIKHEKLTVFQGDTQNKTDLAKALEGCEAIISTLNISRTSDFPWARLRTPKDFLSKTMTQLIDLASNHNIKRVVCL